MADKDANDDNKPGDNKPDDQKQVPPLDIDKLVQEKLGEALKDIKSKLDNAYGARDEALKKVAEFEKEKKEAELKRLQEEGKHKEAYELQLAEEKAKRELTEKRNVELTRDISVRNALASHPFRNDNASEMAYREIIVNLVQNDKGEWVHKTGVSVKDFVKTFAESEENSFLFKPKASSGAGSGGGQKKPGGTDGKSIFELSQEEVLKRAREGTLRAAK